MRASAQRIAATYVRWPQNLPSCASRRIPGDTRFRAEPNLRCGIGRIEGVIVVPTIAATETPRPRSADEFADWVRPHLAAMARLASRLAPEADRDDIVQAAMIRAWQKRDRFDPRRGAPGAWLLAITADQARKLRTRRSWSGSPREISAPNSSADDRIDVENAIAGLPRRQRLAVDCYYFAGLSVDETAAVMGCSVGTVKSTLFDARQRLRPTLEVTP